MSQEATPVDAMDVIAEMEVIIGDQAREIAVLRARARMVGAPIPQSAPQSIPTLSPSASPTPE